MIAPYLLKHHNLVIKCSGVFLLLLPFLVTQSTTFLDQASWPIVSQTVL